MKSQWIKRETSDTLDRGGFPGGGGGELPNKIDGDVRQKIQITPLRDTNVGVSKP